LIALLVYFWKDVWALVTGWLRKGWTREAFMDPQSKLAWYIGLGTIPAILVALPLEKKIETAFRAPLGIAIILMAAGLLMGWAEYVSRKQKTMADMNLGHALFIGCAQALALFPGVSRSGITLTAGLFAGFDRETAARFSFLLALPAVGGACVLHLKHFLTIASGPEAMSTLFGVLASAIVGWLCIHFLLAYLRKSGLYIFMWYRLVIGALVLGWIVLN
jgi:undecaprenyl-diphosphatase